MENPINLRPQSDLNSSWIRSIMWARNAPKFTLNRFTVIEQVHRIMRPPAHCIFLNLQHLNIFDTCIAFWKLLTILRSHQCRSASKRKQLANIRFCSYFYTSIFYPHVFYRGGRSERKRNEEPFVRAASSGGSANARAK